MLRLVRTTLYLCLVLLSLLPSGAGAQEPARVYVIRLDGSIDPNSARYLERGLRAAAEAGAHLVVLEIDTPGGLVTSTRAMVEDILASSVPVAAYVSPAGARAASAGAFIVAAAHVAAMAPGTNIGASTPVSGSGADLPETLQDKATNDSAALIRSVAEARGRNVAQYEAMVRSAASFSVGEAVQHGLVNFQASGLPDLLGKLHGLTVTLPRREVVLNVQGIICGGDVLAGCYRVPRTPVERFLEVISEPNIAAILLTLGGLGLFVEFMNPGLIFPGVFGAIMLVLAFVALGNLPVNWAAAGLILLALVLFYFELQVSGFGLLGLGAVISFLLGLFLLFTPFSPSPPNISAPRVFISPWLFAVMGGGMGAGVGTVAYLAWRSRRSPSAPPVSKVVGMTGRVTKDLDPVGEVYVGEEHWTAEEVSGVTVATGQRVQVVRLEGLVVKVRKV